MTIEDFIRDSFEGHKLLTKFWAINRTPFLPTPLIYSVPSFATFNSKGTGTMYLRWVTLEADTKRTAQKEKEK
jgi:hypothetical protein